MFDLIISTETLKREHAERLRKIEREQLAQKLAGRSTLLDPLFMKIGDLLVTTGQRLQANASKNHPHFEQMCSDGVR